MWQIALLFGNYTFKLHFSPLSNKFFFHLDLIWTYPALYFSIFPYNNIGSRLLINIKQLCPLIALKRYIKITFIMLHSTYPAPQVWLSQLDRLSEHCYIISISLCACIASRVRWCTFAYTYQMRMFVAYSSFAFPFIKEKLCICKAEVHVSVCKHAHGVTYAGFLAFFI